MPIVIAMFGTVGFARPAGFLLLGPAAVCVASTQPTAVSTQPTAVSTQPTAVSTQPTAVSTRPARLDTGARG